MIDDECDVSNSDSEGDSDPGSDFVTVVQDRDYDPTGLVYLVKFRSSELAEWVNRSDLWDEGNNSKLINAYDRKNPPAWDLVCMICGASFDDMETEGCEECRCDICEDPCRHIEGVNYGCPRHAVI